MFSYLPGNIYGNDGAPGPVLGALLQAQGSQIDALLAALQDALDQFFVRRATWTLDRWEDFVGLPINDTLPDADRQDRIISKLRGIGTANIALVKSVAESFTYGAVDVDDVSTDPLLPIYRVRITFVDEQGIPAAINDVQVALAAIMPAHLEIEWVFNLTTWADLDSEAFTWDALDIANGGVPYTWDELESAF